MKTLKNEITLTSKTVFTFNGVKANDGAKSGSQHPTTTSGTNSTYIFNCFK